MPVIGPVLQIFVAILIVIILFVVGFLIYNMEIVRSYTDVNKLKKTVPIFTGMVDVGKYTDTGTSFNTVNPKHPAFRDISPSVNQASGAEFTYNFWMYKDSILFQPPSDAPGGNPITDNGLDETDFILFVHGDKRVIEYKNLCNNNKLDIAVKCPLVKLQRGGDMLVVELNTLASRDAVREQSRDTCKDDSGDWLVKNGHKLAIYLDRNSGNTTNFDKKWFMVTIILNDTTPTDPLPLRNKARCRIYVNGILELDRYIDDRLGITASSITSQSAIRRNTGDLFVGPKATWSKDGTTKNTKKYNSTNVTIENDSAGKLKLADLTYFNYAITDSEIKSLLAKQFSKDWALLPTSGNNGAKNTSEEISLPGSTRSFNAM